MHEVPLFTSPGCALDVALVKPWLSPGCIAYTDHTKHGLSRAKEDIALETKSES